jgi:hypothetical protein
MDFLPIFISLTGLILGLGAVSVIDIHGFLARKSTYWTEATTRSHKITKPLIWVGTFLFLLGLILMRTRGLQVSFLQFTLIFILILNGLFLSFVISPFLNKREKEGKSGSLIPSHIQKKITISFLISDSAWWLSVILFVLLITK